MALFSVRHFIVIKPEMMPDLVHDGIAHFLHDFFLGSTEAEDRSAIDGDFGRQLPARLEEGFLVERETLIEAEEILVCLHLQVGEHFRRGLFLHHHSNVSDEFGVFVGKAVERLLDQGLKLRLGYGQCTLSRRHRLNWIDSRAVQHQLQLRMFKQAVRQGRREHVD